MRLLTIALAFSSVAASAAETYGFEHTGVCREAERVIATTYAKISSSDIPYALNSTAGWSSGTPADGFTYTDGRKVINFNCSDFLKVPGMIVMSKNEFDRIKKQEEERMSAINSNINSKARSALQKAGL